MLLSRAEVAAATWQGQPGHHKSASDVARTESHQLLYSIVLAGLPASTIAPLQRVQNSPARLVLRLDRRSHITAAVHELHWLPVKYRIQFKIAAFMHQVTAQRCPSYIADLVAPFSRWTLSDDLCALQHWLCSHHPTNISDFAIMRYIKLLLTLTLTLTDFGRHAFAVCGLDVWSSLPLSLRTVTSHSAFRRALKTHFYNLAFLPHASKVLFSATSVTYLFFVCAWNISGTTKRICTKFTQ